MNLLSRMPIHKHEPTIILVTNLDWIGIAGGIDR
jgi:hypothetical protein